MTGFNSKMDNEKFTQSSFLKLIENLNDLLLVIDEEGKIKFATQSIKRVLGYEVNEVLGTSSFRFIHPDEVEKTKIDYAELIKVPNKSQEVMLKVFHKSGAIKYIKGHRKNLLPDPEINGIVLTVQDITQIKLAEDELKKREEKNETAKHDELKENNIELQRRKRTKFNIIEDLSLEIKERKKTESQLRESEEKFRHVVSNVPGAVFQIIRTTDGKYMLPFISENSESIFEEKFENIDLITTMKNRVHPDDLVLVRKTFNESSNSLGKWELEIRLVFDDNRIKWLKVFSNSSRLADGSTQWIGLMIDNTDQKLADAEIDRLSKLQALLMKLSIEFINAPLTELDDKINNAMETIGKFTNVDRVYIFDYDFPNRVINNTYEWCAEGIEPQIQNLQEVPMEAIPEWMEAHQKGEFIYIPSVQALLPEGKLRQILEEQDIQTILTLPILYGDECVGFVGFDSVRCERVWTDSEITLSKVFAEFMVNAEQRMLSQKSLNDSEQNFRTFFNSITELIFVTDKNGKIIHVNDTVIKRLGYERSELLTKPLVDLHSEESSNEFLETWQHIHAGESNSSFVPLNDKNGKQIPVETSFWSGNWNNEESIFVLSKDLTKEYDALRKFNKVFHFNPAVMVLTNEEDKFVDVNREFLKLIGYSLDEVLGKTAKELKLFPEDDKHSSAAEDLTNIGSLNNRELDVRTKSGNIITGLFSGEIIETKGDRYFLTIILDITEKKKVERELIKLSQAVEQSPVSIMITNKEGNIEYVNPNFTLVTGYSYEEVINQNPRILKSGEQSEEFYNELWSTISKGENWTGIFHNKKKNGELFWESAIISPLKNEKGKIINYLAVKENITEKVEKEIELGKYREHLEELVEVRTEELEKLNKELMVQLEKEKKLEKQLHKSLEKEKELNEIKTRFISMVSHEFRTPLTSILASADLIELYGRKWSDEKFYKKVNTIQESVGDMVGLLEDVLTLSRTDRGKIAFDPGAVNIYDSILELIERVKLNAHNSHVIKFEYKTEIKKIIADEKLISHIIDNLLTNAVKFSKLGSEIIVRVDLKNNMLVLEVIDEGEGIPEKEIQFIFDAFYRARNIAHINGTGLGLSIVKSFVELHKGKILVESQLGAGTKFNIQLPVKIKY
ncbi:MAG: PAS domain S-box protein [Melioribacteraceae bacterium]|nr:PAS domain S-box protein [Melioribacteraceae bacterium]MCF8356515.1 PAS domain S-box protein [Melioribacteraceae bacterium]MCF8396125.1 PAS domain S-box protein [Melioribacteraceae bacterium]MCF8420958.1 PAS domain S-box protein [Melioribacteraceae bacterium]